MLALASDSSGISAADFDRNSQFAHFGMAATVYLTLGRFLHGHLFWSLVIMGIIAAAVKEFWWDSHEENAATRGSDLEDFAFYCVGIAYALLILYV